MLPIAASVPPAERQQKLERLLGRVLANRSGARAAQPSPQRVAPKPAPAAAASAPITVPAGWSGLDRQGRLHALLDRLTRATRRA